MSTVPVYRDGKDGKNGVSQETCLKRIDNAFAEKAMSDSHFMPHAGLIFLSVHIFVRSIAEVQQRTFKSIIYSFKSLNVCERTTLATRALAAKEN
jgi:hypothetical protein